METSAEQKSEQGLEQGKVYAGTKEKKVKEKTVATEEKDVNDNKHKGRKSK